MPIRLKPINWRLLALHLLGIPFLVLGARQVATIPYTEIIELYRMGGMKAIFDAPLSHLAEEINGLLVSQVYSWFLAILASCVFSALVVWHRRESKLLPVALFGLAILTSWTHYDESMAVKRGLAFLQWPFEAWPLATRLGIVGSALLMLGFLPFLFTWQRPVQERN
ncbi:hypothetical protein LRS06_11085 [Hymenobacter sp. J193]|uniref:hypothetical protein n=1 Tax=Hymenobacter sp. J193 TaxID=2898429 RepID=UPI002151B5DE|nr:hypothetical protein [Hymenobacter sp. J193]MCR5888299.1 hypothetical protein [Hymenobacter sp. J193]